MILSAGDIAVMQALHAVETGKLEWDWTAAFSALVMRVGITAAGKMFPRLSAKSKNENTPTQSTQTKPQLQYRVPKS